MTSAIAVDRSELEAKVKEMYRQVATAPSGEFHFEMGRGLAERLGYSAADLDRVPPEAVESFAGVGFHMDLADIRAGDELLDLGSGSGMDSFVAALKIRGTGRVTGLDMTDAQLAKAERLRVHANFTRVSFRKGYIEDLPFQSEAFNVVISNGVINLSADKAQVFREVARVLRPDGRLAISDIVTDKPLPEGATCNATLWAACIGGAMQQDAYVAAISAAGLRVRQVRENPRYRFLSQNATNAAHKYGVKSVSLVATKA
jgi:ubiquinone/menaquinone biosynthesis C-methylase UbiE